MRAGSPGALVLLVVATGFHGSLTAQPTEYPEFDGGRVYVRGVEDVYSTALRETILRVERGSPRTYYAVVVKSSGPGEFATRNYIDALWGRWLAEAGRKTLPLDPSRSVVILLAIDNRQLSFHGGTVLQSEYGLRGQTIDREIVRPHFIPHAKSGDYLTGMTVLIGEIEKWITAKDERRRREEAQQAARREAAQRDAAALVAKCGELLGDATAVLEERRRSGLELDAVAEQLRRLETSVREAEGRIETDPYAVLSEAKTLADRLVSHYQSLLRIGARQNEATTRLAKAEVASGELEEAIASVRRSGVAVGSALDAVDGIQETLGGLRDVAVKDPEKALAALAAVEERLGEARKHVAELPRIDAQANEAASRVGLAYETLLELRERVDTARVSTEETPAVEEIGVAIAEAKEQLDENCALALRQLEALEARIEAESEELGRAWARHRFLTRTVPLGAAAAGVLLLAALAGLLAFRHARARRSARERLEEFEKRVVEFLDELDALRRRHELLPFSDPDFKEPMTGETLRLYQSVDADHTKLRQRWLELMETKEECERLLATESPLGTKHGKEVLRLLGEPSSETEIDAGYGACIAHLETLEAAHEGAEAALHHADEALRRLREQLAAIDDGGLPTSPYDPDATYCAGATEDARAALTGDPIGSRRALERTHEKIVELGRWTERVLHDLAGAAEAQKRLDGAADLAREKRACGMLLTEEEGNPDPPITRGREEREAAMHALERGDAEVAEHHIEAAFGAADRALDAIGRQVEAQKFCAAQLPERRSATERLRERLAGARSTRTKLEWGFATESWVGVAANPDTAESILVSLDPMVDEAQEAAAPEVQRYFHASDLLAHVREQQRRVEALTAAIDDRLRQLQRLAERCLERRDVLGARARELDEFIARHETVVGEDATQLVRTLRKLREECDDATRDDRPDWPAIEQRLDQVDEGLGVAAARAEEDLRLHERLLARLAEVREQAGSVARLLASSAADRARANHCHREASAALERLLGQVAAPKSDWEALLDRLEGVAADLSRAESWAKEDIRLARQAEAAMRDADRQFRLAHGFLRAGVAADVSIARSLLSECRDALERQAYEEVLDIATRAERSARDAYDVALREARRVEARRERDRRRMEAKRRRHASSFTFGGFRVSSSSSAGSSDSGSSSSSFSSGSSSSSWSSGSSQSSW